MAARRRIHIVPMTVQFGSAAFIDGKSITSDVFYQLLTRGGENPTTSQPSPAAFLRAFEAAKARRDRRWSSPSPALSAARCKAL